MSDVKTTFETARTILCNVILLNNTEPINQMMSVNSNVCGHVTTFTYSLITQAVFIYIYFINNQNGIVFCFSFYNAINK
jgi:hypothetical protein